MGLEHVETIAQSWQDTVRRTLGEGVFKPFAQGAFFDLHPSPNYPAEPIHAGIRAGRNALVQYLHALQEREVHHFAMNLKPLRRPAAEVLQELAEFVLPHFPSH